MTGLLILRCLNMYLFLQLGNVGYGGLKYVRENSKLLRLGKLDWKDWNVSGIAGFGALKLKRLLTLYVHINRTNATTVELGRRIKGGWVCERAAVAVAVAVRCGRTEQVEIRHQGTKAQTIVELLCEVYRGGGWEEQAK